MTFEIQRLKTRAGFQRVARLGRKWVMPGIVVQAMKRVSDDKTPDIDSDTIRIGFTASRRVGNAVTRNRAKRRLRALAAELLPEHAAGGFDLVFIARGATPGRDFAELRADALKCLKKLGVTR